MRLLITEFICGGGLANHALPASLKQEGLMMLQALIADCSYIKDCEVLTTLDPRIQLANTNVEIVHVADSSDYIKQIQTIARNVDMTWVVAPESEGILASIMHSLELENSSVVNCSVDAIRIAGDKYNCANAMQAAGLPIIPSLAYTELNDYDGDVVVKPRFGAGGESLRICRNGKKAMTYIDEQEKWLVQPYIRGEHRSLSLLCWQGQAKILTCNIQQFSGLPEPRLSRCIVNAFLATSELISLSEQIAKAFPELSGYVGVDYIETENGCVIVEINPRLTTSYIGLAKALRQNPAQLCIDTIINETMPDNIENTGSSTEVTLV